jgi:hypothetical protein
MKSTGQTSTLRATTVRRDFSPLNVPKERFVLKGPNGFYTTIYGGVHETPNEEQATAFVDVVAAGRCGKALIAAGYPVLLVKPVILI